MCYRPLHIVNPSLHFDRDHDRRLLSVPCGQCGECRTNRQNEVASRIYYEYLDTVKKGGYVFFQTFTYNEEMVPVRHGIKCFDTRHFLLFSKNLRYDMESCGYPVGYKNAEGSSRSYVKIFWTCEYGGNTYRPHYHALFFVTNGIPVEEFCAMTERNWCQANGKGGCNARDQRVSLGYCDTNNIDPKRRHTPQERVVDGMGALGYVSKYVCKDLDFLKVITNQKGGFFDGEPLTDEDKKYMFPFTRQSNGIGECMKDMLTIEDLMDGKVSIPDKLEGTKIVSLPQYIDRKVFYDYNPEDKCFRLNEQGLEMKKVRRLHNRGYVKKQIDFLWSNLCNLWTPFAAEKLHMTEAECLQFISATLYNRDKDFIDYIIYYKDISSTYFDDIDSIDDLADFAENNIVHQDTSVPPPFSILQLKNDHPKIYYRCCEDDYGRAHPRFAGFEKILYILNKVNLGYCHQQQKLYEERQEEKARQKYLHSLYR